MNNHVKSATRIILSLFFINTLYACDSGNSGNTTSVAKTEMPTVLQKLTGTDSTNLSATVTIDGGAPQNMPIDFTPPGSASTTIPGLTLAVHIVTITYTYTDLTGSLILATATKNVDLTGGSGSISFAAVDYDLAFYDADGDGSSNAAELAAGSDPRVAGAAGLPPCVLGTSTLDNCKL